MPRYFFFSQGMQFIAYLKCLRRVYRHARAIARLACRSLNNFNGYINAIFYWGQVKNIYLD